MRKFLLGVSGFGLGLIHFANAEIVSDYTLLDGKDCKKVQLSAENGGYYRSSCKGLGDYHVLLDEGDSRSSLRFQVSGREPIEIEGGINTDRLITFTYIAGNKLEWRSQLQNGAKKPLAVIYRVGAQDETEGELEKIKDIYFLQVVKITPERACVIETIPANGRENQIAREVADQKAASFVCPEVK